MSHTVTLQSAWYGLAFATTASLSSGRSEDHRRRRAGRRRKQDARRV
ncbi:hypothetical protein [Microtetraspora malaysiensis]|uniref:Uncharacterized protein n=1 Tax=Microtetraspora malaysiensis TaxID=161358 RepID=A0ABW6SVE6_9ACTN